MAYFPPTGSVVAYQGLPSSMLVGASIIGLTPVTVVNPVSVLSVNPTPGSVMVLNPVSILATTQSGTRISSVINSAPSSLLTGASIFGQLPAGTATLGSIVAYQGVPSWNVGGSVISYPGTGAGSVQAVQSGTRISSIVNSIPSSLLTGQYGHRNDNVASYLGGNLSWNQIATDSAGRTLVKPFAAEEARIEGYVTLTSTSLTTLVAATTGLRNYITDAWFANTGSVSTLITFSDSAASVLGYTIAPAGGGSNLPGLAMPIRTGAGATFNIQAGSPTSTLYATVKGFKAP